MRYNWKHYCELVFDLHPEIEFIGTYCYGKFFTEVPSECNQYCRIIYYDLNGLIVNEQFRSFINKSWIDLISYYNRNSHPASTVGELDGRLGPLSQETKDKISNSVKNHINNLTSEQYNSWCNNVRLGVIRSIENGNHHNWNSRNIRSYPELFWQSVLDNNKFDYLVEYFYVKYFLDFLLIKGSNWIDLEIDGKQHYYPDRVKHDQLRDEYLTLNGFIVYRIEWNEINSINGKSLMKSKIDGFLQFMES